MLAFICMYLQPTEELLKKHYEDLAGKPFFNGLIKYMLSGPVCAMVSYVNIRVFYYVQIQTIHNIILTVCYKWFTNKLHQLAVEY